jgi:mRNA interferase RelE/StbE
VSVQVVLLNEAVADLAEQAETGMQRAFCQKLIDIEKHGSKAGQPLARGLHGWRKLTVGDRNWRIVFRVDDEKGVATICVIGNREDEACYREAMQRVKEANNADAISLAESMMELLGTRKARAEAKRQRRAATRQ